MIEEKGLSSDQLKSLLWQEYPTAISFKKAVEELSSVTGDDMDLLMKAAEIGNMEVSTESCISPRE